MGKLRVLLVDSRAERSSDLACALEAADCHVLATLHAPPDLHRCVRELQPDVVIIDTASPDRDTLEDMQRIRDEQPKPIVMFVDESDEASTREAVRAGVAAYVVGGAAAERVRPVIEVAIARFHEHEVLRDELAKARDSLEERKLVDRAKGILMDRHGMKEAEAYSALRKQAMNRGMRMIDVARTLIELTEGM